MGNAKFAQRNAQRISLLCILQSTLKWENPSFVDFLLYKLPGQHDIIVSALPVRQMGRQWWLISIRRNIKRKAITQRNIPLKTSTHTLNQRWKQCLIGVLHDLAESMHNVQTHRLMVPDSPIWVDAGILQKLFQVIAKRSDDILCKRWRRMISLRKELD